MGFLDNEGLRHFWQKIKTKIEDASKTGGVEVGAVFGWTGEGIPEGYNEVKKGYSTEEMLTGKTWTDGKPIYRKVFDLGLIGNTSATASYTAGTNIETLIDYNAKMMSATISEMLPANKGEGITAEVNAYSRNNVINIDLIKSGVGYFADRNLVVTAEYTKTTDTGNFKYIEKNSVTPIDPITGSIVDTFNVNDKTTNAPSVNAVENYVGDSLAEALMPKDTIYSTDLNEIVNPGCYAMTTNVTNEPPTVTGWGGFLIVFKPYTSIADVCCQLFVDANGGNIYIRTNWFGTWYDWKSLV